MRGVFRSPRFLQGKRPVFWSLSFAVIGSIALILTHAATTSSSFEPEDGTPISPAAVVPVASASGGKAIRFGGATGGGGDGIWKLISPAGVSVNPSNPENNFGYNTIVIHPTNPSILYLGTNYQGIYKSTNSGSTWTKINTGTGGDLIDSGRVWTLAIDPFNPNTLWATAGYGEGGPLKSIDGGVSWTFKLAGEPTQYRDVYSIYLDPYKADHLIVAWHSPWRDIGDSGVSESLDGGNTWINHPAPAGSGWGAGNAAWFLNNSSTWLLGSQSNGIWRTTNSGATWTQVNTKSITHGGINSLTKYGNDYYLTTDYDVHKSTDNGVTWTDFGQGLPGGYLENIAFDGTNFYTAPSYPSGYYVDGPWLYRPISGGTWQAVPNSPHTCDSFSGTKICNGPVMSAYDSVNRIAYTVNWNGGVWKIIAK